MELGVIHPDYLLKQLTASQIADWEAYERLEPFGSRHRDFHFGKLGCLLATAFLKNETGKPFHPRDFRVLSRWDVEDVKQERKRKESNKADKKQILDIFRMLKKGEKENGD